MKSNTKSRQFMTLAPANSTPSFNLPPKSQPPLQNTVRVERFLKATNSERYLPPSWRNTEPNRKENSSTSSSGSREDSKARDVGKILAESEQFKAYFGKSGRNVMEGKKSEGNNAKPERKLTIKAGLVKVFPRMVPKNEKNTAPISARSLKKAEPVVICRAENSYETLDQNLINANGSVLVNESEKASLYASLRGNGPRTGESLCQRLLQSGLARKVKYNYFQLKTSKFVSPKIVKASRRYGPKLTDSLITSQTVDNRVSLVERPTSKNALTRDSLPASVTQVSCVTPRGKKVIQALPIGDTDKAKVNREEIKRIFKLNQFKKRVASDLFLDNYRKRISLQISDILSTSPREAGGRSFSAKSFTTMPPQAEKIVKKYEKMNSAELDQSAKNKGKNLKISATSLLLQKVENSLKGLDIGQYNSRQNLTMKSNIEVLEDYTISDSGHY